MTNEVVTHLKTKDESQEGVRTMDEALRRFGDRVEERFAHVGETIKRALEVAAVVEFGRESVKAFSEAEDAEAKYVAMRKANNEATGITIREMKELSEEIQKATKQEHAHVIAVASTLLRYENLTEDVFPRTIKLAVDMAEIFGSLEQSAMMLGRGLNDPINAARLFKMAGVELSEQVRTQIKDFKEAGDVASAQELIFKELEKRFGGLGEAMGDTLSGRLAKINNQFKDIKESIGAGLVPVIENTIPLLKKFGEEFKAAMAVPGPEFGGTKPGTPGGTPQSWMGNLAGGIANLGQVGKYEAAGSIHWLTGFLGGDEKQGGKLAYETPVTRFMKALHETTGGMMSEVTDTMAERNRRAAGQGPSTETQEEKDAKKHRQEIAAMNKEWAEGAAKNIREQERLDFLYRMRLKEEEEADKKWEDTIKKIKDGLDEIQRKSDDAYWDAVAKKTAEDWAKRNKGFTATIEDMFGVHGRIQAAAASTNAPEDKIIDNNSKEAEKNREKFKESIGTMDTNVGRKFDGLPKAIGRELDARVGLA